MHLLQKLKSTINYRNFIFTCNVASYRNPMLYGNSPDIWTYPCFPEIVKFMSIQRIPVIEKFIVIHSKRHSNLTFRVGQVYRISLTHPAVFIKKSYCHFSKKSLVKLLLTKNYKKFARLIEFNIIFSLYRSTFCVLIAQAFFHCYKLAFCDCYRLIFHYITAGFSE